MKTRLNPNKTVDYSEDKEKEDDSHGQRMRGDLRPRRKIIKKDPEQTEDEEIAKLPLDKQELANLILQEINRKYTSVMGQPA